MTTHDAIDWDRGWARLLREVPSRDDFDDVDPPLVWGCTYNGPMTAREASEITREHRSHPADICRVKARAVGALEAEGRRVPDSGRLGYRDAVARLAESSACYGAAVAHIRRRSSRR